MKEIAVKIEISVREFEIVGYFYDIKRHPDEGAVRFYKVYGDNMVYLNTLWFTITGTDSAAAAIRERYGEGVRLVNTKIAIDDPRK